MYKKRYSVDVSRAISNNFKSQKSGIGPKNSINKRGQVEREITSIGKRGQVTIFIIIGILLLLALTLVVVLKSEVISFKPEELLPENTGRVETFISKCIEQSGDEALELIGLQGGHVEVPEEIARDGSLHLKLSPNLVVPYWAYGVNTNIPSLQQIKQRIDNHIESNLRECLFGLEAFQETYDIFEKSEIKANTKISESKVIFNVNWNVELRTKGGEVITNVVNHFAESDVKLKKTYDTAVKIIEREMIELKLEDITQDLIALEHPNVPVAGTELSCSKKEWKVDEVKTTLKDLIRININKLKLTGTEFVEFPEQFPYYQNHYVWDMGEEFVKSDINVIFRYDNNYPMNFQVTPTEGSKMRSSNSGSSTSSDLISFLCIQNWKFTYDVIYPVSVRITDETTGYSFNIAFTVHLVRNIPNRESEIVARPSSSLNFGDSDKYCENRRIPMTVLTWENVENKEQGVGNIEPLDDVDITYTCLKYRCDIGQSDFNFAKSGYQSGIDINFPYCVGGIVRGKKEGYKEDWIRVTTYPGEEVELKLVPLFKFPVEKIKVVKHDFRGKEQAVGAAQKLGNDETALIKMTFYKDGKAFHEVQQVVSSNFEQTTDEPLMMDLLAKADFKYELEINVFDKEKLIGGQKMNWTVSWPDLEIAEEIVFHTITNEDAGEDELYDLVFNLQKYSSKVPAPELLILKTGDNQKNNQQINQQQ
jgi:hypothetical protein